MGWGELCNLCAEEAGRFRSGDGLWLSLSGKGITKSAHKDLIYTALIAQLYLKRFQEWKDKHGVRAPLWRY